MDTQARMLIPTLTALLALLALPPAGAGPKPAASAASAAAPPVAPAAASAAAPTAVAAAPTPAAAVHSVSLRVTEAGTGNAVAKARVDVFDHKNQLHGPQRLTNRDGHVVIDNLAPSRYRLQISVSSAWQVSNLGIDLSAAKPAQAYAVELSKALPAKAAP
jgi:pyruvate/2-oxoglutarate dehydrogenase complex dihydrolipoamide acyltransferase (E2) component